MSFLHIFAPCYFPRTSSCCEGKEYQLQAHCLAVHNCRLPSPKIVQECFHVIDIEQQPTTSYMICSISQAGLSSQARPSTGAMGMLVTWHDRYYNTVGFVHKLDCFDFRSCLYKVDNHKFYAYRPRQILCVGAFIIADASRNLVNAWAEGSVLVWYQAQSQLFVVPVLSSVKVYGPE